MPAKNQAVVNRYSPIPSPTAVGEGAAAAAGEGERRGRRIRLRSTSSGLRPPSPAGGRKHARHPGTAEIPPVIARPRSGRGNPSLCFHPLMTAFQRSELQDRQGRFWPCLSVYILLFVLFSSKNVVSAYPVIICQFDQMADQKFIGAALISGIHGLTCP